jgi:P pilus assembly chaperone PapD
MHTKSIIRTLIQAAAPVALFALAGPAAATAILNPIIVIEPGGREASVKVLNDRPVAMTYRIAIINRRELPGGKFEDAEDTRPGEMFAADFLRFSPRQVTLSPGQLQSIRILASRPNGLPPGEYKSFLKVEEIPTPEATAAISGNGAAAIAAYLTQLMPITVKQR